MRRIITLSALILLAGSCSGDDAATRDGAASNASGSEYTFAVIPKGLGHQFWKTVKLGADAAGTDFNVEILWNGPAKETEVAKQIDIVQDMISRGVDGIVMAACDENALIGTIEQAMKAGITVVIHAGDSGYTTHGYVRPGRAPIRVLRTRSRHRPVRSRATSITSSAANSRTR